MCLFIWLHWVLVAADRIFSCGMRTLSCSSVGSSSLTRDQTWALALGTQSLSHWSAREIPLVFFFLSRPKIEWYLLGFTDLAFNWALQPQQWLWLRMFLTMLGLGLAAPLCGPGNSWLEFTAHPQLLIQPPRQNLETHYLTHQTWALH